MQGKRVNPIDSRRTWIRCRDGGSRSGQRLARRTFAESDCADDIGDQLVGNPGPFEAPHAQGHQHYLDRYFLTVIFHGTIGPFFAIIALTGNLRE